MKDETIGHMRKATPKSKFATVNAIMPNVIVKLGLDRRMQERALFSLWPSLVDPIYASRSMPLYIDEQKILVVAAENGSTAQELSFLKSKLLAQLQQIGVGLGLTINGMRFDLKRFSQIRISNDSSREGAKIITNESAHKPAPSDSELAALVLSKADLAEIGDLKEKLEAISSQMHLEKTDENPANQLAVRITQLVEKQLRLKKWCSQQNIPVCEQCAEPLPQSSYQLNIKLCPGCKVES